MQTVPSSQDPAIPVLQSQVAALLDHKHLGTDSLQVDYSNLTDIEKAEGKVLSIIAGGGISLSPSDGVGDVTVTATVANNLTNVRGNDTATLNTHSGSTTHTITHALGRTVTMIKVWATLVPNGVSGANADIGNGIGEIILDGAGNVLGGTAIAYYTGAPASTYGNSIQSSSAGSTSFGASTQTSGGVATMAITVQNVTSTTFDIVYSVSDNGGFGAPTQNFTAYWMVI